MTQIFVSYSHNDHHYLEEDELIDYLRKGLNGKAQFWYDGAIATGERWNEKIHENILGSQIALLLISDSFIQSDYINKYEIQKFFTATIKKFVVFPVILSPCDPQKLSWLKDIQYIPPGDFSIEKNYPAGPIRDELYKKILTDMEQQLQQLSQPGIKSGQALSSLVNLVNTIGTQLLTVCKQEHLINHDHSLMFEGRSSELIAKKVYAATGFEMLTVVRFEELKDKLLPDDFIKINGFDQTLTSLYSKWFTLDSEHSIINTEEQEREIIKEQYKIILQMFPALIKMLEYLNRVGFDLNDHYYSIYSAMGVIDQTKAMDTL